MPTSNFVTASFKAALSVPKSCIESTEYIIRSIALNNYSLSWTEGEAQKPYVLAVFGGGRTFNISAGSNFHNSPECVGLADFNFNTINLQLGHGIILLNNRSHNTGQYNMHLGAVVAIEGGYIYLSDVSEHGKVYMTKSWAVNRVRNLNEFRGHDYAASKGYAMGLLMPEPYFKQ